MGARNMRAWLNELLNSIEFEIDDLEEELTRIHDESLIELVLEKIDKKYFKDPLTNKTDNDKIEL